jgi:4-hydroxy-2-oxoheptanedioate aldolase
MLVGLLQTHPNPLLVKMADECGYDFLFVDAEHGLFADSDYEQIIQTLASTRVLTMVRLAHPDPDAARKYVDIGADVVVAPHISTIEQAKEMGCAVKQRSVPTHRAIPAWDDNELVGRAEQEMRSAASLLVIIESVLGVSNAEAILAVDGVDGAFIGPSDLTADLGSRGDYSLRTYADALLRVERAAAEAGKFVGTVPHGGYTAEALFDRGHRLLIAGADISLMRDAMIAQVANAQACQLGKRSRRFPQ